MSDQDDYVAFLRRQRRALRVNLQAISHNHAGTGWLPDSERAAWDLGSEELRRLDQLMAAALRQPAWTPSGRVRLRTLEEARDFEEELERQRGDAIRSFGIPPPQLLNASAQILGGVSMADLGVNLTAMQERLATPSATSKAEQRARRDTAADRLMPRSLPAPVKPSPNGRINWPLVAAIETGIWGQAFDHDRSYERAGSSRRIPFRTRYAFVLTVTAIAAFMLGMLAAGVRL
jgi:hypothetical protein